MISIRVLRESGAAHGVTPCIGLENLADSAQAADITSIGPESLDRN